MLAISTQTSFLVGTFFAASYSKTALPFMSNNWQHYLPSCLTRFGVKVWSILCLFLNLSYWSKSSDTLQIDPLLWNWQFMWAEFQENTEFRSEFRPEFLKDLTAFCFFSVLVLWIFDASVYNSKAFEKYLRPKDFVNLPPKNFGGLPFSILAQNILVLK